MPLSFKTRSSARQFNAKRMAKGLAGPVVDNGKEYASVGKLSRYAVVLR